MKTAWIAGASGLVGSFCLKHLLDSPVYSRVVAVARRELPIQHPKLTQALVNFAVLDPSPGVDDVFCCLGTTIRQAGSREAFRRVDFGYVVSLAEAAVHSGANQFLVVSSVGADPASPNFYLRVKGEMERAILQWPFAAVHLFRPSLLIGPRRQFRFAERLGAVMAPIVSPLLRGSLRRYRPVQASAVAGAMLAAAARGARGRCVYEGEAILELTRVTGPT
ncbi:oxidoreductase [Opitutaceae bacterium EW11]|nr:oxidoreductase [Opitutaceae bacterium EW11]